MGCGIMLYVSVLIFDTVDPSVREEHPSPDAFGVDLSHRSSQRRGAVGEVDAQRAAGEGEYLSSPQSSADN